MKGIPYETLALQSFQELKGTNLLDLVSFVAEQRDINHLET